MSDEQSPAAETVAPETNQSGQVSQPKAKPPVVMIFLIMALLGALIATNVRKHQISKGATSTHPVETEASGGQAAAESESIEDIAKRLKSDTDTLVAMAGRFQEILAEKDRLIRAKDAEVLAAEKSKQAWVTQFERLQDDLGKSAAAGSEAEKLRNDVASLAAQRDSLAAELKAAIEKNKTLSAGVSAEELADVQRQLTEAVRAKEFFESRVKELEGPPK
jgi:hypothetical protein